MKKDLTSMLNKRVTILESTESTDQAGNLNQSWREQCSVFASIKAMSDYRVSGNEFFTAMQLVSVSSYLFIIRYLDGITTAKRLKYRQRYFNIKRVINDHEQNYMLKIIAEEEGV